MVLRLSRLCDCAHVQRQGTWILTSALLGSRTPHACYECMHTMYGGEVQIIEADPEANPEAAPGDSATEDKVKAGVDRGVDVGSGYRGLA